MTTQRYEVLKHIWSDGFKIYDTFLCRWVSDVLCCQRVAERICANLNYRQQEKVQ